MTSDSHSPNSPQDLTSKAPSAPSVTMKAVYAVPAVIAIVGRAYAKKSLTPAGLVAATLTAIVHAWHPWPLPFVLLGVFFFAGTRVTHVRQFNRSNGSPARY